MAQSDLEKLRNGVQEAVDLVTAQREAVKKLNASLGDYTPEYKAKKHLEVRDKFKQDLASLRDDLALAKDAVTVAANKALDVLIPEAEAAAAEVAAVRIWERCKLLLGSGLGYPQIIERFKENAAALRVLKTELPFWMEAHGDKDTHGRQRSASMAGHIVRMIDDALMPLLKPSQRTQVEALREVEKGWVYLQTSLAMVENDLNTDAQRHNVLAGWDGLAYDVRAA